MSKSPLEVTQQFIERIDRQDVNAIVELMAADHVFVDSGGDRYEGREHMRQGWVQYYRMIPDYRIDVEQTLVSGNRVAVFGVAAGTCAVDGKLLPENRWSCPAAWLAVVEDGKMTECRNYCDLEPLRRIINGTE